MVRTLSEMEERERALNEMMNLIIDHATLTIWPRDRFVMERPMKPEDRARNIAIRVDPDTFLQGNLERDITQAVTEAVAEERERCAKIAEHHRILSYSPSGDDVAEAIAQDIREGK